MKETFMSFFNTQSKFLFVPTDVPEHEFDELGYSSTSFHCHKLDGPPIDVWFKRVSKRDPTDNITKLVEKEMSEVYKFRSLYQFGGSNSAMTW